MEASDSSKIQVTDNHLMWRDIQRLISDILFIWYSSVKQRVSKQSTIWNMSHV